MQVLEEAIAQTTNPWPLRRERAAELATRYPYADQMLGLYQALVSIQEAFYLEARSTELQPKDVPAFTVERVMPSVIDVTVASGPARLRDGVIKVFCTANLDEITQKWLAGQALDPFGRYLARASASPLLEAISLRLAGRAREGVCMSELRRSSAALLFCCDWRSARDRTALPRLLALFQRLGLLADDLRQLRRVGRRQAPDFPGQ